MERLSVATVRSLLLSEDPASSLDDLLYRVCEELQLSSTRYDHAVDRYAAVCNWLEADGSPIASFRPTMYPQGSMRIGTTVRPLVGDEFDLDFVCEFAAKSSCFQTPLHILGLVYERLRSHETYKPLVELKNRCVRLNYATEFYMDILPACPDEVSGGGCLLVPDRQSRAWKASNPKGYANWFLQKCALARIAGKIFDKAEPVPAQEDTEDKAPLKRVVQLLKRWRDIRYSANCENAPISMVLTTLAALHYSGQQSVVDAMTAILDGIQNQIEASRPRIFLLNPTNQQEDLSERWENPKQYAAFVAGIRELRNKWSALVQARGLQNVSLLLEELFGEPVKTAVKKQADEMRIMRDRSNLRVASSGVITTSLAGVSMRPNTFH